MPSSTGLLPCLRALAALSCHSLQSRPLQPWPAILERKYGDTQIRAHSSSSASCVIVMTFPTRKRQPQLALSDWLTGN